MPVISSEQRPESASFAIVSEFAAPVERVWRLWADPRQVERWWGPPGYPATFVRHDFAVPGRSIYYMTDPEGVRTGYAYWRFLSIEAPTALELENGFGDEQGEPAGDIPSNVFAVRLEAIDGGTRMTVEARFGTPEALEQLLGLGMLEGATLAFGQIDAILAEG